MTPGDSTPRLIVWRCRSCGLWADGQYLEYAPECARDDEEMWPVEVVPKAEVAAFEAQVRAADRLAEAADAIIQSDGGYLAMAEIQDALVAYREARRDG